MLYIGNDKIIKGYVGDTPITHVGMGYSDLIEITQQQQEEETGYCIEYTVDNTSTYALNGGTTSYKYGLPRIYRTTSSYSYTSYEKIER